MRRSLPALLEVIYDNPWSFHRDFDTWLVDNLHIFDQIVRRALEVKRVGFSHYGIATLWEVARHHTNLTERTGEFKLNNNWAADVAALAMLAYPDLDDFFQTRERKSVNLGCFRPGPPPDPQMELL